MINLFFSLSFINVMVIPKHCWIPTSGRKYRLCIHLLPCLMCLLPNQRHFYFLYLFWSSIWATLHLCTSLMRDAHTCVRVRCFKMNWVFLTFIFYVVLQLYSLPIFFIHLQNSNILLADDGHWPATVFNVTWCVLAFLIVISFILKLRLKQIILPEYIYICTYLYVYV